VFDFSSICSEFGHPAEPDAFPAMARTASGSAGRSEASNDVFEQPKPVVALKEDNDQLVRTSTGFSTAFQARDCNCVPLDHNATCKIACSRRGVSKCHSKSLQESV
jgi:hypothetical protein